MTKEERERIAVFEKTCNILNFLFAVIWVICLIAAKISGLTFGWEHMSDLNFASVGVTMCIVHIMYTFASIKRVWINEFAILLLGGSYLCDLKPGWRYIPFGFCEVVRETRNIIEKDIPGSPEFIFYGDTTENKGLVPPGYIPALYITFAANPHPGKELVVTLKDGKKMTVPANDPLLNRLVAQVQGSYGFRINDLKTFYETVIDLDSVIARMDDIVIGGFKSRLAQMTVAEAKLRLEEVAEEIRGKLVDAVKDWGVEVQFVRITRLENSHSLNKVMSGVAEADELRKATISASIGKAEEIRNLGAANADAEYDLLAARTDAYIERAVGVASSSAGQFTMAVEAIQEGLSKGQTVFVPTDNPFAAIGGIKKMFDNMPQIEQTETPLVVTSQQGQPPQQAIPQNIAAPEPKPAPRYGSGKRKKKGNGK